MLRLSAAMALPLGCALLGSSAARAQFGRGAGEWMNDGGDPQRSFWIRTDPKISLASMSRPGFALVWKIALGHEPGQSATLDHYIGYRGFRSLAMMGSQSGEITAIDTDLGRVEWKRSIAGTALGMATANCPGGVTANVVRPTAVALPAVPGGRGGGRSNAAKSGVGESGEGAVTIAEIAARAAAAENTGARGGRGPAPPAGFGRTVSVLDAIATDGALHSMYVSNGEDAAPPVPFLPRNANAHGLVVVGNTAYAATSQGCGGAPNGIWALDLTSKAVVHWSPASDIAGAAGMAFGPDGTVYAATTSGELVSLDPKTLQVKATYRSGGVGFTSTPVVFELRSKAMMAAGANDGRVHVVDAGSMTGASYPAAASGELASWQDPAGVRWILAPSHDAIAAWKIGGSDVLTLQSGWTSREMASPMTPVIVNGVIFAVSNGATAVLYALDSASGKELWNSGKTIGASVRTSGLSGSGSQLYLGASDRTIYAFGFPIEH